MPFRAQWQQIWEVFEAFFSSVISGAAGTYIVTIRNLCGRCRALARGWPLVSLFARAAARRMLMADALGAC
eukprot:SAG22_NODE_75_length_22256_cov_45.062960_18_plen_71_part_00